MNTFTNTPRARSSSAFVLGLAWLLGSLPGCYIDAKIGDDPESDGATTSPGEEPTTDPTAGPGATSGQPGTASATSSTSTSAGEDTGPVATSGGDPSASGSMEGVDPETALELCGVVVVPPGPGDPIIYEGIECAGGCTVDIETSVPVGIYDYGECLCDVMLCGDFVGGTTGSTFGDTDSGTTGDPDGCGPFPDGEGEFTCSCEMCSIDVTSVDATWIDDEADLPTICECMCGGAGCGSPV